ncbi:Ig-like domain-containing protein [Pseudomonas stutzeri]|nr:Ig-like domain-containing protein [Stutzerimonas stutzeri]
MTASFWATGASFTGDTVDYTVTDGSLTDTATLTLTVTPVNDAPVANDDSLAATEDTPVTFPVNDAPVANDDSLAATEDTPVTFSAADLLGNDSDVDGDSLSIASVTTAGQRRQPGGDRGHPGDLRRGRPAGQRQRRGRRQPEHRQRDQRHRRH